MCGIAGFVLQNGEAPYPVARAMCDQIRHRGPDDEGYYVHGPCAIGMRRLSIIDLSTGHQPIGNEDGSIQVVFNGEIYNYQELRRDLAQKGHRFATNSDTETLVHLYEEEGVAGISRLRGMFAFAVWDARRRRLLLARDRFGKKPLYYAALPHGLFFGSELKCLRAAGVPLDLDRDALRLYFQFAYIPDPYSPFAAIRKLPPGCWLSYTADGALQQDRYWRPAVPAAIPPAEFSASEARTRLRQVFDEAVRIRMIADVPLGAFLSGGIDSSSVVASMALQSRDPVKTFSIGFAETGYNELPYAAAVARKYGTEHHEILVRPDAVDLISRLVQHFDEPFGDSSAIPTFIVSEFAARYVKVALSGDGGDELLAGYERFAAVLRSQPLDRLPGSLRGALSRVAEWLPYSAYGKNYLRMLSRGSALERYFERNFLSYYSRKELLRPEWMLPAEAGYLERILADFLPPADADALSRVLYFETAVNLPGDMLVKVDRMSMANSLEVRCPLLDQELAALAVALPHTWKIHNGQGKHIFIQAMADRLPPEVWNRPKMGFGVPLGEWFRGPLRSFVWDHLRSPRFLDRQIVSPAFLEYLLQEHDRGRRNNKRWLWPLLMLELWFRQLEEPAAPPAPAPSVITRITPAMPPA
jgi:asparagine synthase (glutamine-hydrolysing)